MAIAESCVKFPWVISLAREDANSLGGLRLAAGLEVGDAGALIWLRGKQSDEGLDAKLAALPARERYEWLASNQLRRIAQRIPSERLPEVRWQTLDAWLQVEMPTSAIPANLPAAVRVRLVRSTHERDPDLVLTSLDELSRFAKTGARVRLDCLQLAADSEGNVLVRGKPLPPLPGRRFVVEGCVAVPSGFSWEPAVSAEVLTRCLGVSGDALVVWNEDGTITRLHSEQFVPMSRSAIRATQQALAESR